MAKTKTSGVSMTNAWLAEQGVLSLKSFWAELAHLRETAQCSPAYRAGVGRMTGNAHPYPISAFSNYALLDGWEALRAATRRETQLVMHSAPCDG